MSTWKEGDRVRIKTRPVTEEDRKTNRYFDHMAGLVGTVQNIYSETEIAVKIDEGCMSPVTAEEKFIGSVSEEQRKQLTKEELEFNAHYVQLVVSADLEPES